MNNLNYDLVNFDLASNSHIHSEASNDGLINAEREENYQFGLKSVEFVSRANNLFISTASTGANSLATIIQEIHWEFSEEILERECSELLPAEAIDQLLVKELGPSRLSVLSVALVLSALYIAILVVGAVGNVASAIVTVRRRELHSAPYLYVLSLSVSGVFMLAGVPYEILSTFHHYPYPLPQAFCIGRNLMCECGSYASALTVTAFSIDRFLAVRSPMHMFIVAKRERVIRTTVLVWALAMLASGLFSTQFGIFYVAIPASNCTILRSAQCGFTISREMEYSVEASSVLFFLLPGAIIGILHVLIIIRLRRRRADLMRELELSLSHDISSPSFQNGKQSSHNTSAITNTSAHRQSSPIIIPTIELVPCSPTSGSLSSSPQLDIERNCSSTANATKHIEIIDRKAEGIHPSLQLLSPPRTRRKSIVGTGVSTTTYRIDLLPDPPSGFESTLCKQSQFSRTKHRALSSSAPPLHSTFAHHAPLAALHYNAHRKRSSASSAIKRRVAGANRVLGTLETLGSSMNKL